MTGQDMPSAIRAALVAVRDMKARLASREREPIAIVGIGCRFPGATDGPDGFWRMLCEGVDAVAPIPAHRWDADVWYDPDPSAVGKTYCRHAAMLPDVTGFDAAFFNIAPREAVTLDPQQRLLLETAWEALEHAGIAPDSLAGSRTGVFVGTMNHDYELLVRRSAAVAGQDEYAGTGTGNSFQAGRLAYVLGLSGPALAVDTACSSSALAAHLACQSLRSGECDMAIAGAANLILVPDTFVTMARFRALAPDGRCKTFDASADGYGRGEGAGVVVLQRLSDARAAGRRVIAVIAGSAVNHDGAAAGLTVPNGIAQQAVIRAALAQAELPADRIGYVEAHGTGTILGDPIEITALAAVQSGRPADRPLLVGSVKTNFGHLEAAAGIAAIIKVALMLRHGRIPPNLHFDRPNPAIDFAAIPAAVPTRLTGWPDDGEPRCAGVSAFGMSGTNVHLILRQDAPEDAVEGAEPGPHVLALSARDDDALAAMAGRIASALGTDDAPSLADAAWTLATGRKQFERRLAVVADTAPEAASRMEAAQVIRGIAPIAGDRTKVAFVFSGQGVQWPGMAAGLYRSDPAFRETVDRCLGAVDDRLDPPLAAIMWDPSDPRINQTAYAQPALFAVQAGLVALWRSLGVQPDLVLGHSVGEFAAAWTAGVLDLEDAMRLVAERGRCMQALPGNGTMIAVQAAADDLTPMLDGHTALAGINGAVETVLSGHSAALEALGAELDARNIRWRRLAVSHAFHSPLMQGVIEPFMSVARTFAAQAPKLRWVSTVTGRLMAAAPGADYWGRQIRDPVLFAPALSELARQNIDCAIEIGPGATLTALARRALPDPRVAWLPSLRPYTDDRRSLREAVAAAWTAGVAVRLEALHRADRPCPPANLPTYPFQRQRHWIAAEPPPRPARKSTAIMYRIAWEPLPLPESLIRTGRWLVVADTGGIAGALAAAGLPVTIIAPHDLVRHLDGDIVGVLYLPALDLDPWAVTADLRSAVDGVLTLARAAVALGADSPPMLWVTRAAQPVGTDVPQPAGATLWGLGRTIALEYPEAAPVLLDLPPDQPTRHNGVPDKAVAAILGLLPKVAACRDEGERQWAWRPNQGWLAPRLTLADSQATPAPLRADRAYLVTGGMRGVGLSVALHLARQGARHVVLAARSQPSPAAIAAIEQAGARAYAVPADVADRLAFAAALAAAGTPPLAGVVHAAGVLDNAVLAGLHWPAFARVLAPKVDGLATLLAATTGTELDFLVLFASGAGVLGSAGQGNYAAANAYLDAAAAALAVSGQRAISIAWGPWSGLGMAAAEDVSWARKGVQLLEPEDALAAFSTLTGQAKSAAVLSFDWVRYRTVDRSAFLDRLAPRPARTSVDPLPVRLRAAPARERQNLAEQEVWELVRTVLQLPPDASAEPDRPFAEFGMDSLMALDVRTELARRVGRPLPATLLYDHPTLTALARYFAADPPGTGEPLARPVALPIGAEPPAGRKTVAAMNEADLQAYVLRKRAKRRQAIP
jgi:acyl transferase domain-containing protein